MFSYITQNGNDAQYLSSLLADSETDIQNLPTNISPGSTCFIEETGATFMLSNAHYWFKVTSGSSSSSDDKSRNNTFQLKGTITSMDELPTINNLVGDTYIIGPDENGAYDEYYWSLNSQWELMGHTTPDIDLSNYIDIETFYAGMDNIGTIEEPAENTIMATINQNIEDKITGLQFKRLDKDGNEDNNSNSVSIISNDEVIGEFFSSSEKLLADVSFVSSELVSYFTTLGVEPETYNSKPWTAEEYPIADMTEENGPYLVLVTISADDTDFSTGHMHVKTLKGVFDNYLETSGVTEVVKKVQEESEIEIW